MKTNRRSFISRAITGSLAATMPLYACQPADSKILPSDQKPDYSKLDEILKTPVFKKEYFALPVIIDSLELLQYGGGFLCRVRSKDGAEGISVGHSGQLISLYPIFTNL